MYDRKAESLQSIADKVYWVSQDTVITCNLLVLTNVQV